MKTQQLYIPETIKVGFQKRSDTYTKKLAYVSYFDHKGVLRKEKSWQSWRDKKIDPVEFKNEPMEGFVLNKGVGGARESGGWNARNEYIRVYDPRDFEFEISVANLLFILREYDCSRGKGLEGKFVYSWDGNNLVLLPVSAEDYKASSVYTGLQSKNIAVKDLIPGATYVTRKMEELIYLGRFDRYFIYSEYGHYMDPRYLKKNKSGVLKNQFVLWDRDKFVFRNDLKNLAAVKSSDVHSEYAKLVDKYNKSIFGSKCVELKLVPTGKPEIDVEAIRSKIIENYKRYYREDDIMSGVLAESIENSVQKEITQLSTPPWYIELEPQVYYKHEVFRRDYRNSDLITDVAKSNKFFLNPKGVLIHAYQLDKAYDLYAYPPKARPRLIVEPAFNELHAVLENGAEVKL